MTRLTIQNINYFTATQRNNLFLTYSQGQDSQILHNFTSTHRMESFLPNFNSTQTITIENYSKIFLFLLQRREEKELSERIDK
jgi:hypothetical protein